MPDYNVTVEITLREITQYLVYAPNEEEARAVVREWAANGTLVPTDCTGYTVTIRMVERV